MSGMGSTQALLERLDRHSGASVKQLRALREAIPGPWPADYLECLAWSDGPEGYVGGRGYLWLWPSVDVPRLNNEYAVAELAPGLVLFGSDAAALGYGFDFSAPDVPVVSMEMSAMHRGYLGAVAPSFSQLVTQLAAEPWPDDEPEPDSYGTPE